MKVYGISGLGADERVFEKLHPEFPINLIQWLPPQSGETLDEYAKRLSDQIDPNDEIVLIGVSFGGMVAIALQQHVHPVLTILISSAQHKNELPSLYRWVGRLQVLKWVPSEWMKLPKGLAKWLFGAKNKKLLYVIIEDTDTKFLKWALMAITSWKHERSYENVIKIHGTKDRMIPYVPNKNTIAIKGGGHFMIVDRAEEISNLINERIKNIRR